MNQRLEQILDELSLLTIMMGAQLSPDDLKLIIEQLCSLKESAGDGTPIATACDTLIQECSSEPPKADLLERITTFISQTQSHLRDPSGPSAPLVPAAETPLCCSVEMSKDVDPQFLVEFIEKHSTLMEEFEGHIIDYLAVAESQQGEVLNESRRKLKDYVKGYIHNVKGDAGSIGLLGIERVCHFVEDQFVSKPIHEILDALLALKGWTLECLRAFAAGTNPNNSSDNFKIQFSTMLGESAATSDAAAAPAEISPHANNALLAELELDASLQESNSPPTKKETPNSTPLKPATPTPSETDQYKLVGEPEIFQEFAAEAEDHLAQVESLILESGGEYSSDAVGSIFRSIHSIKGSSSYFGLKEVTETSHATENLLDEVRDGIRAFDAGLTELLLVYLDLQKTLIADARDSLKNDGLIKRRASSSQYISSLRAYHKGTSDSAAQETPSKKESLPAPQEKPQIAKESAKPLVTEKESESSGEKLEVKTFVKVDTRRLDQLIDAIGEMGIYSSMLIQKCRSMFESDESLNKVTHQVEKVTKDVQNIGIAMRLVPIRSLFQKMSRLVWDLGKKIGKDIKFTMNGEETELDRTIIDLLADPLMHMVRNSLDHGIESPEERIACGKSSTGNVSLSAFHSAGSIHVRIEDDGKGLDPAKLITKAIEKGLIDRDQKLSNAEAYNLIFAAGFSTAAVVTDVSGRGVGMDVVKRNIESLRGRIHIQSTLGKGTIFTIELPLTLAILDGIEISVGKENFLIPMLSVTEFIKPKAQMVTTALDCAETFSFRGKFLPVYRLSELFGISSAITEPSDSTFMILDSGGEQFTIMVDQIVGSYSTVIKNLGEMFEQGKGIAGAAIRADGSVALILDVRSLLTLARQRYEHRSRVIAKDVNLKNLVVESSNGNVAVQ